jgi:hypothetical protein
VGSSSAYCITIIRFLDSLPCVSTITELHASLPQASLADTHAHLWRICTLDVVPPIQPMTPHLNNPFPTWLNFHHLACGPCAFLQHTIRDYTRMHLRTIYKPHHIAIGVNPSWSFSVRAKSVTMCTYIDPFRRLHLIHSARQGF